MKDKREKKGNGMKKRQGEKGGVAEVSFRQKKQMALAKGGQT